MLIGMVNLGEESEFGEKEIEMRFHNTANFTKGYHSSVSTRHSSINKWLISHRHYRQINPSVTKFITPYRHYRRINPLAMKTMSVRR